MDRYEVGTVIRGFYEPLTDPGAVEESDVTLRWEVPTCQLSRPKSIENNGLWPSRPLFYILLVSRYPSGTVFDIAWRSYC